MQNATLILTEQRQSNDESLISTLGTVKNYAQISLQTLAG